MITTSSNEGTANALSFLKVLFVEGPYGEGASESNFACSKIAN